MDIAEESLTRGLMVEIVPLLQKHKESLPSYGNEPININWKVYQVLSDGGLLKIYTVRDESKILVGYAVFVLTPNMRHQHMIQAQQDVLYIAERARKGDLGYRLLKFAAGKLEDAGASVVLFSVNASYDYSTLLSRLGCTPLERTFIKKFR